MEKGIYRAIDANINRSMEGLRVCEDIMRFTVGTPRFSERLKRLRHELAFASSMFSREALIDSREVEEDSGKFYDLPSEKMRDSTADMLGANIHRAIEAVRSLEEFSKLVPCNNRENRFQKIRFDLYGLEKEILSHLSREERVHRLKGSLYCILDSAFIRNTGYIETARQMIRGGAGVLQLSMKGAPDGEILSKARELSALCREEGVLFIVNEHADIACLAGADGLHLGQDDLPVPDARRILPASMIIGVSASSCEQAAEAGNGPDYLSIGPVFATNGKSGEPLQGIGIEIVRRVCEETPVPVVATGGITPERIGELAGTCCASFAVMSCLYRSGAIEENCRELVRKMDDKSVEGPG